MKSLGNQAHKVRIEMSGTPPEKNNHSENEAPPCGCAIGDLLKVQKENQPLELKDTSGDSIKQLQQSDLPACGCAIGDLLDMQKENKTPVSGEAPRKK
jgi:hypothetical protein